MIDTFYTENDQVMHEACEAMRTHTEFRTTIIREQCDPPYREQYWRGHVTRISRLGDGFEIEVAREDT